MSLIDTTYFVGEITILNLNAEGSFVEQGNVTELGRFITKYEAKFLIALLGQTLYDSFQSAIADAGESPLTGSWLDLQNKLVDSFNKLSPIANYVYYWYKRNNSTSTTAQGETVQKSENAVNVADYTKMVRAWNEMSDQSDLIWEWLCENVDTYTGFDSTSFQGFGKMNTFGI